jgi:hypothetical protein
MRDAGGALSEIRSRCLKSRVATFTGYVPGDSQFPERPDFDIPNRISNYSAALNAAQR